MAGLGVALKVGLLLLEAFPFHADEAVVGLMATHIQRGEWPAFFYGQAYMGSLDASLVSLAFMLLGRQILAIRVVQTVLYAGTIVSTMLLAARISGPQSAPLFAGALMAIPVVNVTLYTTVSLGGYGEALLLGNLLLLTGLRLCERASAPRWYFGWGVLAGLAFWGFGLTIIYSLPAGYLVARSLRAHSMGGRRLARLAAALAGAVLGAGPWVVHALRLGPAPFVRELFGSAVAGVEGLSWLGSVAAHTRNLLLFGATAAAGLRPPWEVRWLAWPLLPLAAGFWLVVAARAARFPGKRTAGALPAGVMLGMVGVLCLGFVLTPFGADPSGRYFLPLATPMAVFGANLLCEAWTSQDRRLVSAVLVGVLAFNLWGTLQSALRNPPGLSTQFGPETRVDAESLPGLGRFLKSAGELRGYTHYWVAYPLAFHTDEQVIFVPRLPYHADFRYTARDDRYPPYKGMVDQSPQVAYITSGQPLLERAIRSGLTRLGVYWQEARFGDYHIFYRLSRPVRPDQLGLPGDPG